MAESIRDTLLDGLRDTPEKDVADESVKDMLVGSLESAEVYDALTDNLLGLEGVEEEKRRRGRPRKDSASIPQTDRRSMSYAAVRESQKEKARKSDRLNPQPTEELKEVQEVQADLRELDWDMADLPDSRNDAISMIADIDNLREEAGLKKLDDTFLPYAEYRQVWNDYYAIKKESKEWLEAVKQYVGARDLKKAKELMESLKGNIKRMNDGYGKVYEAYEKVCAELMSIAETRDDWRGSQSPMALEVMKQGFGMMDGENGKRYIKRMRSIGRSREIPRTIKDIDNRVAQAERRWRSIAGISPDEFRTIKENWQKSIRGLSGKVAIATNMKIIDLNRILEGRYGEKKRGRKPDRREDEIISSKGADIIRKIDNECFGRDGSLMYGCLHTLSPVDGDNEIGGAYGKIVVRWKPQSAVATMLLGNSLDIAAGSGNGMAPSLFTEASPCSFAPENKDLIEMLRATAIDLELSKLCEIARVSYVELQLHGEDKYKAEDIESISFGSEDDYMNVSSIGEAIIEEFGIPLYICERPMEKGIQ